MTRGDRARDSADKAIVQQAIERSRLAALLQRVDLAEDAHPQYANRVAVWAKVHAAIAQPGRVSTMVVGVCEWFFGVHDMDRIASELVEQDRKIAKSRQGIGRRIGRLRAAVTDLEYLGKQNAITDGELTSLRSSLNIICERLTPNPESKEAPLSDADKITAGRHLGEILMDLMLATGYGPKEGRAYSSLVAANLVADIAALYGFSLGVKQLENAASRILKSRKNNT